MSSGESATTGLGRLVDACGGGLGAAEDATGAVEVLAVFDHDHQAHILVQEWDHTDPEPRWTYRLWFRSGEFLVAVHHFTDALWPEPPFVAAAIIAAEWRRLIALEEGSRDDIV